MKNLKREMTQDEVLISRTAKIINEAQEPLTVDAVRTLTEVADKYLQRFKIAEKQLIAASIPENLNKYQKAILEELKEQQQVNDTIFQSIYWMMNKAVWNPVLSIGTNIVKLSNKEQVQVVQSLLVWIQIMEEEHKK